VADILPAIVVSNQNFVVRASGAAFIFSSAAMFAPKPVNVQRICTAKT
jgi:hypothetical protein